MDARRPLNFLKILMRFPARPTVPARASYLKFVLEVAGIT